MAAFLFVVLLLDGPHILPMHTLVSSDMSGAKQPIYAVINNRQAWQDFWMVHTSNQGLGPEQAAYIGQHTLPDVDFSENLLVAAAWGQKPNSGFSIGIRAITLSGRSLIIEVDRREQRCLPWLGLSCVSTLMVTSPVVVVSIAKPGLAPGNYNFVFKDTGGFFWGETLARGEIAVH
jgi:hypothetical protein